MADSVVRLQHTYGQAVQQQVLRERLAARMKTAKPEELCAVLDTVTDGQDLEAIQSYIKEWTDEQQLTAFAKHMRDRLG
jgi:hypothetical protein